MRPYIAWQAHIGGLIAGGLLTAAFAYAPRPQPDALIQVLATVAMLAILVIVVVVRNHQLLGTFSVLPGTPVLAG